MFSNGIYHYIYKAILHDQVGLNPRNGKFINVTHHIKGKKKKPSSTKQVQKKHLTEISSHSW
jgi:hypothetical protein